MMLCIFCYNLSVSVTDYVHLVVLYKLFWSVIDKRVGSEQCRPGKLGSLPHFVAAGDLQNLNILSCSGDQYWSCLPLETHEVAPPVLRLPYYVDELLSILARAFIYHSPFLLPSTVGSLAPQRGCAPSAPVSSRPFALSESLRLLDLQRHAAVE